MIRVKIQNLRINDIPELAVTAGRAQIKLLIDKSYVLRGNGFGINLRQRKPRKIDAGITQFF